MHSAAAFLFVDNRSCDSSYFATPPPRPAPLSLSPLPPSAVAAAPFTPVPHAPPAEEALSPREGGVKGVAPAPGFTPPATLFDTSGLFEDGGEAGKQGSGGYHRRVAASRRVCVGA